MCFCSRLYGICFLFRDRGISVQLIKYQMYTEICVYTLVIFFLVFLPVEKEILLIRIIGILNTFLVYVVQPLFYLSGDVNFRNRVLRKGLWLAIKTELFETPNAVRLFSSKSAMRGWVPVLYLVDLPSIPTQNNEQKTPIFITQCFLTN